MRPRRCWRAIARCRASMTRCWRRTAACASTGSGSSARSRRSGPRSGASASRRPRACCARAASPSTSTPTPTIRRHAWPARPGAPGAWRRPTGAHLAAGLIQRARLIEAVLADLYGNASAAAGRASAAGPGVRQPGPSCGPACAARATGARTFCSTPADVARTACGRWVVLGDQTETPSATARRRQPGRAPPRLGRAVPRLPDAAPRRLLPRHAGELFRHCAVATTAGSCCSARGPRARPISATPTSPAISATRWSRAAISPCATTRST